MPSPIHESIINVIQDAFNTAIKVLGPGTGLKTSTGQNSMFEGQNSCYISDMAVVLNWEEVFHLEVAFSQTEKDARNKIKRMLESPLLVAVFLVEINEKARWSRPFKDREVTLRRSREWSADMEWDGHFGCVEWDGVVWIHDVEVYVSLFERGNTDSPTKVCFALLHLFQPLIYLSMRFPLAENLPSPS